MKLSEIKKALSDKLGVSVDSAYMRKHYAENCKGLNLRTVKGWQSLYDALITNADISDSDESPATDEDIELDSTVDSVVDEVCPYTVLKNVTVDELYLPLTKAQYIQDACSYCNIDPDSNEYPSCSINPDNDSNYIDDTLGECTKILATIHEPDISEFLDDHHFPMLAPVFVKPSAQHLISARKKSITGAWSRLQCRKYTSLRLMGYTIPQALEAMREDIYLSSPLPTMPSNPDLVNVDVETIAPNYLLLAVCTLIVFTMELTKVSIYLTAKLIIWICTKLLDGFAQGLYMTNVFIINMMLKRAYASIK